MYLRGKRGVCAHWCISEVRELYVLTGVSQGESDVCVPWCISELRELCVREFLYTEKQLFNYFIEMK